MASVEFCKIPPLPWPSMGSMVAWTSIESIGWIPWKWSPIAPWIPHKLSVESMETYRKRRKLIPLNYALNFHCFLEVHGNGVQILHGSGSGIHGIPWISETGVVQQMHVLSDVFWVTESKSILVFEKFLYCISLSQNIFFTTRKDQATKFVALLGPDNFFLTTWEPDNLFFNKWKPDNFFRKFTKPPPPPWVSNGPPLAQAIINKLPIYHTIQSRVMPQLDYIGVSLTGQYKRILWLPGLVWCRHICAFHW